MNQYVIYAGYNNFKEIKFLATDLANAYFKAALELVDRFENLSDESIKILENSDVQHWVDDCKKVYKLDKLKISDVEERYDDD